MGLFPESLELVLFYMKSVLKVAGLFLSILLINLFYSCNKDKSTLPGPPTVKTLTVIEISYKSATSGGNVTSDGGPPIVSRGICWDTSFNPTVNNAWCRYMSYDDVGTDSYARFEI